MKTVDEFEYTQSPNVIEAKIRDLTECGYIKRAGWVLFIGEGEDTEGSAEKQQPSG